MPTGAEGTIRPDMEGAGSEHRLRSAVNPRRWRFPPRDAKIGTLQDAFLIAAVAMILVIRTQLWLTNYPQLGGGTLHIAHLLWGGVLMVIAIGMLLSFVGRGMRMPAAIVGGLGFGFFIDELGKFITNDNDYFFKPAAGVIYLVFIGLYLLTRWMQRRGGLTPREHLVNAVDALTEAARRDLNVNEKHRALELLEGADPEDPLTEPVRGLLEGLDSVPAPPPTLPERAAAAAKDRYLQIVETRWFTRLLSAFFVVWAAVSLLLFVGLVALAVDSIGGPSGVEIDGLNDEDISFVNVASMASSVVAGLLVIWGVVRLQRHGRLEAYRMFERALLVQIFVGQVFSFVESQFSAVFGLAVDVLLLVTVRYMIKAERQIERDAPTPPRSPAAAAESPA